MDLQDGDQRRGKRHHRKRTAGNSSDNLLTLEETRPKIRNLCRQFENEGNCKYGSACRFSHDGGEMVAVAPAVATSEICRRFLANTCTRGNTCPYLHVAGGAVQASNTSQARISSRVVTSTQGVPLQPPPPSLVQVPVISASSAAASSTKSSTTAGYLTTATFASLPISPLTIRAITEVMKYTNCSIVQEACIPIAICGGDIMVKAKTGTGKTLGFLIPTIDALIKIRPDENSIRCLVLSPTRELAVQISTEAHALLTYHRGMRVVTVVGGTNINTDKKNMNGKVDFLVATPGRLIDHLENTPDFSSRCAKCLTHLIFDEADQLLDMGFRPEIEKILGYMPPKTARQTLLFSATIPQSLQEIARNALRPGYQFIDTVGQDADQTHQHVTQELVVMNLEDQIPSILSVLMREMSVPNFKIIVFFTTARLTGYMARLFQELKFKVLEIHSRKSQSQRTKCSDEFRDGKNMILFSSDVSARGMDYPDITFVLQVGLTEREQYIHRLGRTARAGKEGRGMLLLAPFEEHTMRRALSDIALIPVSASSLNMPVVRPLTAGALAAVTRDEEFRKAAEQAYGAWLGFYNSNLKKCGWDKPELVVNANIYSRYLGLPEVPYLEKKTVGKMGLKGVPGLRVK